MATPAYRIRVDWNQDGDFSDTNEDVTSDIRTAGGQSMKYRSGKAFPSHHATAGMLELMLKNDDHKYSPSLLTGAIYPLVLPGPDIWVELAYPMDNFNASNGTTLASRKPPYDSLFAAWAGDATDFDIQSNKLVQNADDKTATLDFGESDCWVDMEFTYGGTLKSGTDPISSHSGMILRWTDNSNFLQLHFTSKGTPREGFLFVYKENAGTGSSVTFFRVVDKDGTKIVPADGDVVRITAHLHGNDIEVFVDDVYQGTATDSFNNTATKHGIGGQFRHADDRFENFGGWRTVFFGRIDTIQPRPENNRQYCYIRAFNDMERLKVHQTYKTAPTGGSVTAKAILDVIHDAVDVPSQHRIFDTGTTLTVDDKHEASIGRNGLTEIYQVQDDDVGFYYVDGRTYRYEASDHRDSAPHTTFLKTWRGDRAAGDETDMYFSQDRFEWNDGKDAVENEVYYVYNRISRTTATQVWRLETDDRPAIAVAETLQFLIVGDNDNIANPRTPLHTTDFTVNTAKDGTGTDLLIAEDSEQGTVSATGSSAFTIDDTTQDFTDWNNGKHVIRITDSSGDIVQAWIGTEDADGDGTKATLYKTSALTTKGYIVGGDSGFSEADTPLTYNVYNVTVEMDSGFDGNFRLLKIVNNSGSAGFVTFLRLIADKGTASSKTAGRAENAQSQLDVGRRRIEHTTVHIDNHETAEGRAIERVRLRQLRKERLTLAMPNKTRANMMQIIHRSLSDRINIKYTSMGIDDTYHIEHQQVTIAEGGLWVNCEWVMQQSPSGNLDYVRWNQLQWA